MWYTAQEARGVLPNDLKTELMMTGDIEYWNHFFSLRAKPDCHPQLLELTMPLFFNFKDSYGGLK
jgi:thymidylate synthase ThyX